MSIDILENSATNGESHSSGGSSRSKGGAFSWLWDGISGTVGDVGRGAALTASAGATIGKAAMGIPRYMIDTLTAEKNDVPLYVRAAIAAAPTATDKLKTLRRYFPDAMPTGSNDFTFKDPKTGKRFTLDDNGLSLGDAVSNIPAIGEMVGGTAGAIAAGLAGGASTGGVGAIPAAAAGAALGGVGGKEIGTKLAKYLGYAGSGFQDEPIDTQTSSDYAKDMMRTGAVNALGGALGPAYSVLRNSITKKLLTEDSAALAKELLGKGYSPTLSQIGSDRGIALNKKMVGNSIIEKEVQNQKILNENINKFLGGEVSSLDQNAISNQLRTEIQDNIAKKYGISKEAYKDLVYREDYVPAAETTLGAIQDIFKKRGMVKDDVGKWVLPNNKRPNSDFVFESKVEDKIDDVINGNATEAELFAFEKDLTPLINDRNTAYRSREVMIKLRDALRKDLASGEGMDDKGRLARQAHFEYKNAQDKLSNAMGKTEGVSEGVAEGSGQGLTAAQNIDRIKKLYLRSSAGDDTKAAILNEQLAPYEKKLVLASMLREPPAGKGALQYLNPVEQMEGRYDINRIMQNLIDPEEATAFSDLLKQAKGTTRIPEGAFDRSGRITPEGIAALTATSMDPAAGAVVSGALNVAAGTPGTAGGSGGVISALLKNSPIPRMYDKFQERTAIKAALANEGPGNLRGPGVLPYIGTEAASQKMFGNLGRGSASNLRISQDVREEPIRSMGVNSDQSGKIDLDSLLKTQKPSIDLDALIGGAPAQEGKNPQGVEPSSLSVGTTSTKKLSLLDAEKYIADNYKNDATSSTSMSLADAEKYIADNYGIQDRVKDRSIPENQSAQKLLSDLQNGTPYYRTEMFSEGLKSALAEIESGVKGYAAQAHNSSAAGKYQFLDATRKSLLPGVSREEFINTPALQERAMDLLIQDNINNFKNRGIDVDSIDPSDLTGLLFAAHLRGPSQAAAVYRDRSYQGIPDPNGTTPRSYFDRGKSTYENA